MAVEYARSARSVSHETSMIGINETTDETNVRQYARACIVIRLQHCRSLIMDKRCWTCSVAFEYATNKGDYYLDIRMRIHVKSQLHNLHLIAIPMCSSHTGIEIFI